MAMRKRPQLTELAFDRKVDELTRYAEQAVSPFRDRSREQQRRRKDRAAQDFFFFARTYLPHYFEVEPAEFHRELIDLVSWRPAPSRGEVVRPVAVAAPRGFAKSTLLCLGYVLWELLHSRRNFVVLGSETKDLAEDHVASLAAELTGNRRIAYDYAPRIERLKNGNLVLAGGGRVLARGAGQQFRGLKHRARRPDLVILDDLESDKQAINPKRVKFLLRWIIGTVYPAIDPAGSLFIIGTIISRRSMLATLVHSPDEPYCLWERRLYRALTADGESLWPAMYTRQVLEAQRRTMGAVLFAQEKMNDPRDEEGLFQEEWLRSYEPAEVEGVVLVTAGFCDPSARQGESNDYKAVVIVGLERTRQVYYVLDAYIRRCSVRTVAQAIAERQQRYGCLVFGVEDNGFQRLFLDEVARVADEVEVTVPFRGVTHTGMSKEMRLAGLSPLVERGVVRFPAPQYRNGDMRRLVEQLIYFPSATVHDDGPDALEGAVSLLRGIVAASVHHESVVRRRMRMGRGAW